MIPYRKPIEKVSCALCSFSEQAGISYLCRRKPPQMVDQIRDEAYGHGLWPLVKGDDWCGDFIEYKE